MSQRVNKIVYSPHPGQKAFHDAASLRDENGQWVYKYLVLCCGRRWGKDRATAQEFIRKFTELDNRPNDPARVPHTHGWILAPTYPMAQQMWLELKAFWPKSLLSGRPNEAKMQLRTKRGGLIEVKSAHKPDDLVGVGLDILWITEAARVAQEAWLNLRPTLNSPGRAGIALINSTPKGNNWFSDVFWRGQKTLADGNPNPRYVQGWWSRTAPSLENTHLEPHQVEEILRSRTEWPEDIYRQEYEAAILDNGAGVFRGVHSVIGGAMLQSPQPGRRYVMGVDVAKVRDFTVLTVMDTTTLRVVYFERFNELDWEVQISRIIEAARRWRCEKVLIDSTQVGDPVTERIQRRLGRGRVEGYKISSNKHKIDLIQPLQVSIEKAEITIPNVPVLIQELLDYQYEISESGKWTYNAAPGKHDDCLKKGTLIKTSTGYKPIEDVRPGDLVLTHLGRYKPVEVCIDKPFDGTFYRTKFQNQVGLDLSYNHPLYAASRTYMGDVSGPYTNRQWVFPGDWRKTYRCVSIIEQLALPKDGDALVEGDFYTNGPNATRNKLRSIPLDEGFAKLLGRFIADGHCRKHGIYGLELAFADTERTQAEEHEVYLRRLGAAVRRERMANGAKGFKLVFASKLLWYALRQTYNQNGERRLPEYAARLGTLLQHTLEQWLEADGWYRAEKQHHIGCTTSLELALAMRDVAMSCGRYATIKRRNGTMRNGNRCKDQYWVTVRDTADEWPETARCRRLSEMEYGSTGTVMEPYHYTGTVYNLQVAEDRSFVANGIVVHNCVISLALTLRAASGATRYLQRSKHRLYSYLDNL